MSVPRTRIEQVAGIRPPISRVIAHYGAIHLKKIHEGLKKAVPHPKWVFKWALIGATVVVFLTSFVLRGAYNDIHGGDDAEALEKARQKQAEAEQEAEAKAIRVAITERATTNWETWKAAFVDEASMAVVCYHGKVFNEHKQVYEITCQLGPKGHPPTKKVHCDEHGCDLVKVEP